MTLTLPDLSLVVLVGVSDWGKSTFARKHFRPTEILSSDACRAMVSVAKKKRPQGQIAGRNRKADAIHGCG